MATYLQNVTDYIPQIQPFKPDYGFLANVLQQRQSNYDSNYNKLSSVYTSLYNSPMSRESDIARKDAFFKTIDQDIKKISGMDLSLQQNMDTASKVFEPFYNDKNLIDDMVKTKKIHNNIAKHNALKSCVDPTKCDGQSWDIGLAEQMYKLEEYKKTSDADALTFQIPDYTAKYNWQKEAIELAGKEGFNVTQSRTDGRYIVTDTNGILVKGGLYSLYKEVYGNDPRVDANYKTEAYVQRKRAVEDGIEKYGSEEASQRAYLNDMIANSGKRVQKMQDQFDGISEEIREKINHHNQQAKNEGNLPDDDDSLAAIIKRKADIANAKKHLEITANSINNNSDSTELNTLIFRGDAAAAFELEERDLLSMAQTMSLKGMNRKIETDDYGVQAQTFKNQRDMAAINYGYDKQKGIDKFNLDLQLEMYKAGDITEGTDEPIHVENYGPGKTFSDSDNKTEKTTHNLALVNQLKETANDNNENFIVDAFNTIYQAATKKVGASATAAHILDDNFGKNWRTLKERDQILNYVKKSGKSSTLLFNSLTAALDPKKNSGEVSWAKNFMDHKSEAISDIKLKNLAAAVAHNKISESNKKIIGKHEIKDGKIVNTGMIAEGINNPIFYDSDLILDSRGFLRNEAQFKVEYNKVHQGRGNADKAYKIINDKYLERHDATPGILLDAAAGITGGGNSSAKAIQWNSVTPRKPSQGLKQTKALLNDLFNPNNIGSVKAVLGDGSKENIDDLVSTPGAMTFINYVRHDLYNTDKTGIHPNITVLEAPIIGNDINKSGVTITINNPAEYLDKFYGSEKQPGIMDASGIKRNQLEQITLYYPNKDVNTSTTRSLRLDPLETVVKTEGYAYDSWTTKGGYIELRYDQSSGMVHPSGYMILPDDTGRYKEIQKSFNPFPISQLKSMDIAYKKILKGQHDENTLNNDPRIKKHTKESLSK